MWHLADRPPLSSTVGSRGRRVLVTPSNHRSVVGGLVLPGIFIGLDGRRDGSGEGSAGASGGREALL